MYYNENGVYQFRDRESHMVISTCSDLDTLKVYILRILNRYKNYDLYLRAINSLSEKAVSERDFIQREKEYKKRGTKYLFIIEEVLTTFNETQEDLGLLKNKPTSPTVSPTIQTPPVLVETSVKSPSEVRLAIKKRRSRL